MLECAVAPILMAIGTLCVEFPIRFLSIMAVIACKIYMESVQCPTGALLVIERLLFFVGMAF